MSLEERINRLERENRHWRLLALGLAGLMGFWLSCAAEIEPKSAPGAGMTEETLSEQGDKVFENIRTRALTVVNENGEVMVSLIASGSYSQLNMSGKTHKLRLSAGSMGEGLEDDAEISLTGEDGKTYIGHDSISLKALDPIEERKRNQLMAKVLKGYTLTDADRELFKDDEPNTIFISSVNRGGIIDVHNPFGKVVVSIQSNKTNEGAVYVNDVAGKTKKFLTAD
jgi:hypothetical protein